MLPTSCCVVRLLDSVTRRWVVEMMQGKFGARAADHGSASGRISRLASPEYKSVATWNATHIGAQRRLQLIASSYCRTVSNAHNHLPGHAILFCKCINGRALSEALPYFLLLLIR